MQCSTGIFKEMLMKKKSLVNACSRILEGGISVVCILLILIGVYITIDMGRIYRSAAGQIPEKQKPEEVSEETPDLLPENAVAWITLDGTTIDYPVMQADNNFEYLSKDPEGNYSVSGSIFLDCRNAPDLSESYLLVYGHHMSGELMFGALDRFFDPDYFNTHRTGTLRAGDRSFSLRTAALLSVPAGCAEIFELEDPAATLEYIPEHAQICYPEDMTEQLLALTTCDGADENLRTVLVVALKET